MGLIYKMLLEEIEKRSPLPRNLVPSGRRFPEIARAGWGDFVRRLRQPKRLDSYFFLAFELNSKISYLDQASWFESAIAGYDPLASVFRSYPEDFAAANVLDYGFIENGLLKQGRWIIENVLTDCDIDAENLNIILPSQLELAPDLYEFYAAIARHDDEAIGRIPSFSLDQIQAVPFKLDYYGLEEFSPLGYAVAHDNIRFVNAAASSGVRFSECRAYDQLGLTHLATLFGSASMLRSVLGNGGITDDLDGFLFTPLETAVHRHKADHVDILLSHNADPNYGIDISTSEVEHATVLAKMSVRMYQRLRNAGARFDLRELHYHWTPLHYNATRFQRDTFIQMVNDGLDPNAQDYRGETPFEALRKDVPRAMFEEVYQLCMNK